MLWQRSERVRPRNIDGRTLVWGHNTTPLFEIEESRRGQVICLDNGCFDTGHIGYGSLVALNLDSHELLVQEDVE